MNTIQGIWSHFKKNDNRTQNDIWKKVKKNIKKEGGVGGGGDDGGKRGESGKVKAYENIYNKRCKQIWEHEVWRDGRRAPKKRL